MSLHVVVGGQFGSEAKGAVTAAITAEQLRGGYNVSVVRVGGPNAGHSAYDAEGRLWALRQVPAGMVVGKDVVGVIADGSEVDVPVLLDEIEQLEAAGHEIAGRLYVSGEATLIEDDHKNDEASVGLVSRVGSTGKGIGAARAARVMRSARRVIDAKLALQFLSEAGVGVTRAGELGPRLTGLSKSNRESVVIEGVQGYGLGLRAGFYPQCTSSDVRAIDALAAAGINPWAVTPNRPRVHVVVRPYPIRVAGNSGPLKGETSWEELGLQAELTTVTKKVRRVGAWDDELVAEAMRANGPGAMLAVSMLDQVPGFTRVVDHELGRRGLTTEGQNWLRSLEEQYQCTVCWYGTGPRVGDWRKL